MLISWRHVVLLSALNKALGFSSTQSYISTNNGVAVSSPHFIDSYSFTEVAVAVPGLDHPVKILEATAESQEALIDAAFAAEVSADSWESDPYGSVLWPAAYSVSVRLLQLEELQSLSILELGTGTGLVSLSAALGGARSVLATDFSPLTCRAVAAASCMQHKQIALTTAVFDVKDMRTQLPPADLVVIADLMYDASLGIAVAKRVLEAVARGSQVIVGDSPLRPGRPYFLKELAKQVQQQGGTGTDSKYHRLKGCEFRRVAGLTVSGHRNDVISTRSTPMPQPTTVDIFEVL
jgi:predicted nicotinamide N-methyase